MRSVLYQLGKDNKPIKLMLLYENLSELGKQRFTIVNGEWSGYYCEGCMWIEDSENYTEGWKLSSTRAEGGYNEVLSEWEKHYESH